MMPSCIARLSVGGLSSASANRRRSGGLAAWINPIVRGWMTYYGKFYRSGLYIVLRRINTYLVRWARRKFKWLRSFKKVKQWWNGLLHCQPRLFAHWAWMTAF